MRIVGLLMGVLLLAASACGGETQVGSGDDIRELGGDQNRLGEILQEEEDNVDGKAALGAQDNTSGQTQENEAQAAEQARRQQEQQVAQQKEQAAFAFSITASGYDPYYVRILSGGTIKVTNRDSVQRSVTADKGEFDSGMLAPGESWVGGPFNDPGTINFHDATRPYVVGTLEVCADEAC